MKSRITFVVLAVSLVCCRSILAGQVIGYITDPCDYLISADTDITKAWVEKNGTNLTFVMVMRGTIRSASLLPGYNDSLTYVWYVDADNDPTTGQSPGWVGSEFNIRAVISKNPALAGGFVDAVGSMTGGGTGTVNVTGNKIQITINRSQTGAVRRLHWRSDAWQDISGSFSGNGVTPMSGLARVCRYGVLFDAYSQYSQVGNNYINAFRIGTVDPVIAIDNQDSGQYNIFLSDERKYPGQDNWQIFGQTVGHAGPYNLRTFCRFDVENADPCDVFGYGHAQSLFNRNFILDGNEGETGMIPHGVFFLKWSHDYHILASDAEWQTNAFSTAQVTLYQLDPFDLKGNWQHQLLPPVRNNDIFYKYEQVIDLADIGLELGRTYQISALLMDDVSVPQPSDNAKAVSDASLLLNIDANGPEGDIDQDWDVDFFDFALFAENWLEHW